MPQPMSTPTAAGITAPSVGITDPTVAPLPRCASGISATCGNTKGRPDVATAWARVASSRIEAQLNRVLLIFSTTEDCPLSDRSRSTGFRGARP